MAMDVDAEQWVREVKKYIAERATFLVNGLAEQDPEANTWARAHIEEAG